MKAASDAAWAVEKYRMTRKDWIADGNDPAEWDEYHGKSVKKRKAPKAKAKPKSKPKAVAKAKPKPAGKKAKGKTVGKSKSKWKAPYDERDDASMQAFWALTPKQMFDSWQGGYAK